MPTPAPAYTPPRAYAAGRASAPIEASAPTTIAPTQARPCPPIAPRWPRSSQSRSLTTPSANAAALAAFERAAARWEAAFSDPIVVTIDAEDDVGPVTVELHHAAVHQLHHELVPGERSAEHVEDLAAAGDHGPVHHGELGGVVVDAADVVEIGPVQRRRI